MSLLVKYPFTSFLLSGYIGKTCFISYLFCRRKMVTRGFPLQPKPGEPTDHPHHIGCGSHYENVNGLDFWNNSYAIPKEKKHLYGWIRTDKILKTSERQKRNTILPCKLDKSKKYIA